MGASRRDLGLLLLGASLGVPRVARAVPPASIAFRVLRNGGPVGSHRVIFAEAEGMLQARSELVAEVRLLGIRVYRYRHEIEEAWAGERLRFLSSRLDRNGTRLAVEARAEGGALRVVDAAGQVLRLPAETAPLTWWRARSFTQGFSGAPLLDVRDGKPVRPTLERLAPPPGGGARWKLIGGEGAEIGYDRAGRWIEFATTGEDGSAVTYEPA